jgi:hypothetical protein
VNGAVSERNDIPEMEIWSAVHENWYSVEKTGFLDWRWT